MRSKQKIYADVLFCDDIRNELGGKISLMGLYTKDLVVPEIPYILPTLGLFVTLAFDDIEVVNGMEVCVSHAGIDQTIPMDEDLLMHAKGELQSSFGSEVAMNPKHRFSVNMIISPFRIKEDSFISVDVKCAGGVIHGGHLGIRLRSTDRRQG